jgi:hypothetical protein
MNSSRELPTPVLAGLRVKDSPVLWEALGFEVSGGTVTAGGVTVAFGDPRAVAIEGVSEELDGVPTFEPPPPQPTEHPNGVTGIDHFVIVTPDFDRTEATLAALGLTLRRVRDAGGFRQGFRRVGPAILELVEAQQMPPGAARFWGITFIASDLDALAERLGPDRLRPIKDAVQQGRRIATLDRAAGLKTNVAFMTPED